MRISEPTLILLSKYGTEEDKSHAQEILDNWRLEPTASCHYYGEGQYLFLSTVAHKNGLRAIRAMRAAAPTLHEIKDNTVKVAGAVSPLALYRTNTLTGIPAASVVRKTGYSVIGGK